jgi:riboflavin kinase/FMN adenylyltransferase
MLGRRYSVLGPVIRGQQLGQKLGFPTANVDVRSLVLPPGGVYAGRARAEDLSSHPAVVNIGYRPTLNQPQPTLAFEVHLLDFDGLLYDREIEFEFLVMLRREEKFASLADLKAQIRRDVSAARALLHSTP